MLVVAATVGSRLPDARSSVMATKGSRALDPSAPEPLRDQLADLIRDQIRTGELAPRTKLTPSIQMADELGVSRSTVTEAMSLLREEGLVRFVKGKGIFTAEPGAIKEWLKGDL
jgi:DNA-binding GntR family transcriptional regulator